MWYEVGLNHRGQCCVVPRQWFDVEEEDYERDQILTNCHFATEDHAADFAAKLELLVGSGLSPSRARLLKEVLNTLRFGTPIALFSDV